MDSAPDKIQAGKRQLKPGTMIYPLPAVIVSCGGKGEPSNLVTVAWTGTICTNPPMCYISLRPERFSYPIIERTMEFTINLTTASMARVTDWIGVRSGRDYDKWKETGLTPVEGVAVGGPMVGESPVNIECRVERILPLGSHNMILARVVNVLADEALFDTETDALRLDLAGLMNYAHGSYFSAGERLGRFGFSVMKKKTQQRLQALQKRINKFKNR